MSSPVSIIRQNFSAILQLASQAGQAILEVYATAFDVKLKEDHSPLTLADKRSNEIICAGLARISGIPILSEEMKQVSYEQRRNWKTFWLVDPLDGTKEFIKRNGEFTVNIALIEEGIPVFGLIYIPVSGILYYALKGEGAYISSLLPPNNIPRDYHELLAFSNRLPAAIRHPGEFIIAASRSHLSTKTQDYINSEKEKHPVVKVVSAGSSLKFCLVAEGKADAYPRFGPTMEWDTAAGQILITETGKKLVRCDTMEPMTYNKPSLLNPDFLVY